MSALDTGAYDSSFSYVDIARPEEPLPKEQLVGKTVNLVVGPTGAGKTSLALIMSGLDPTPSSRCSGTKNCKAIRLGGGFRNLIFWDTPGLMDTENTEEAKRTKILGDMMCAIKSAGVIVGAIVICVPGTGERLQPEWYEWMTALLGIFPDGMRVSLLATKVNTARAVKRFTEEVNAGNKENVIVGLMRTGKAHIWGCTGEEPMEAVQAAQFFATDAGGGRSASEFVSPMLPNQAREIMAELQRQINNLQGARDIESRIRDARESWRVAQARHDTANTWWNNFWSAGWVRQLRENEDSAKDYLDALESNRRDPVAIQQVVEREKQRLRDAAARFDKNVSIMHTLIGNGAHGMKDAPPSALSTLAEWVKIGKEAKQLLS